MANDYNNYQAMMSRRYSDAIPSEAVDGWIAARIEEAKRGAAC